MQKNIISRTIKNISIILLMFVAVLFLLFWSIFFDFKENAFIKAMNTIGEGCNKCS